MLKGDHSCKMSAGSCSLRRTGAFINCASELRATCSCRLPLAAVPGSASQQLMQLMPMPPGFAQLCSSPSQQQQQQQQQQAAAAISSSSSHDDDRPHSTRCCPPPVAFNTQTELYSVSNMIPINCPPSSPIHRAPRLSSRRRLQATLDGSREQQRPRCAR
jgi:hypothetical protein